MYPGNNSHLGTFIKQQVDDLQNEGFYMIRVVKDREGFLAYVPFLLKYVFYLLFGSYDLVHAYYGFHSALFAAIIKRKPLVITFVGSDALREPLRNRVYRGLQRFVISRSNHLIAVSSGIRKSLISELGADPGKVSVITFGINFRLFRPIPRKQAREKLGFPSKKRLVLFPSSPKMACNLPIVSVNVGDAAEIIKDTRNCYVCEQDPSAIADKIKLVLDDGMRTGGRDSIRHLSSKKIAKRIVGLYRELSQCLQ